MPLRGGAAAPKAEIDIAAAIQQLTAQVTELAKDTAAAKQQAHDVKGYQQQRIAVEHLAARQPAAAAAISDVPVWLKIVGAVGGVVVAGLTILGIIWNLAITPVNSRLDLLERNRVEATAALTAASNRLQAAEAKIVQTDTAMATATRIRDQQQQALQDQVRVLAQADQAGTERIAQLAQTIAGLLPRVEEILRRQERLENRLSGPLPRNGTDEDTPAVFAPAERET
jgi:hypothetical protein